MSSFESGAEPVPLLPGRRRAFDVGGQERGGGRIARSLLGWFLGGCGQLAAIGVVDARIGDAAEPWVIRTPVVGLVDGEVELKELRVFRGLPLLGVLLAHLVRECLISTTQTSHSIPTIGR